MKLIFAFLVLATSNATCKKTTTGVFQQSAPVSTPAPEGVKLIADGPGNTYELINAVLGGNVMEDPDCAHPAFGKHVSEVFDSALNKYVFSFWLHVTPDNDRCNGATDRQRNEIKTFGPSSNHLKGQWNDTVTYRWKFKMDANLQASPRFTHLHQIKAGDGANPDAPIITLSPRHGNPDKLEIIHTGNTSGSTLGKVKVVDLAPFKGVWLEVVEKVIYKTAGTYELSIKRLNDGAELLSYRNESIDLWREGATFCRPKWGIYRSLDAPTYLRDEEVRFADFCIAEGRGVCR